MHKRYKVIIEKTPSNMKIFIGLGQNIDKCKAFNKSICGVWKKSKINKHRA
jgi:hypothetical protein